MYPMLERNILSFLNHKLCFVTPAEVANTYLQLTEYQQDLVNSSQSHRRDIKLKNSLCKN